MNEEFILGIIAITSAAIIGWVMGWHYGAKSLRNRHAKLIEVVENFNEETKKNERRSGNNWYDGYQRGIGDTLDMLDNFLQKFRE